jgi:glycosyltransferase involved in cell wall biosynthesis
MPKVTVLMPVYNGEKYLREAIDSILNQTFTNFEFLIIDDGSTDKSLKIINSYQDHRIRLVQNFTNKGIAHSLNSGIDIARGEYIARMDCDDISLSERLEKQINYLEKNLEIGILGTPCILFTNIDKNDRLYPVPITDLEIRWTILLSNPFAHPSIVMRHSILSKNKLKYNTDINANFVEDYELWIRFLQYTKGENLKEPLLKYRLENGVTNSHRKEQLSNHDLISFNLIKKTFPNLTINSSEVAKIRSFFIGGQTSEFLELKTSSEIIRIVRIYLSLLKLFLDENSVNLEIKPIKSQETRKVGRLLIKNLRNIKDINLLIDLLKLNPNLLNEIVVDKFFSTPNQKLKLE